MRPLRILLTLLLCVVLPLSALSGCGHTKLGEAPVIALMPLDSRPCNTQYPALLAESTAATLLLPPEEAMDQFLEKADTEALWQWLEHETEAADEIVIFTNSLFCGGLIASRSSGAYDDAAENLARLETLCTRLQEEDTRQITVVQVLPRLSPNQFDDALFPYYDALTAYGEAWDASDAAGQAAPESADGVPEKALSEYRTLHEESTALAQALDEMASRGLIDRLIISQDDGAEYCPANITFRHLSDHAENTQLLHGADELAMLLVVNSAAAGLEATPIHLVYANETYKIQHYPYEATSLEEMIAQKLQLAGLSAENNANTTLYLHTDTADTATTKAAASNHDGLFGLADVAVTNQADPALTETLLSSEGFSQIDAYAGWNTAGNSVGTVCAELRALAVLDARWDTLSEEVQTNAVQALYTFRAVRLGEDVGYMAGIRSDLQQDLAADNLQDHTSAFADKAAWDGANVRLADRYTTYNDQLAALFNGSRTLTLGEHKIPVTITNFTSTATFPWPRSFEVKIDATMTVTIDT
ncbi:MAG: DUF4127 family protein [Peptococcaceae bacterium]|nr:DUF4127 family protein [Peptococcaceae bacterium]